MLKQISKLSKKVALPFVFASLLFTGCAQWQDASGIQKIESQKVTIDLSKDNWHALNLKNHERYMLTKDGMLLQQINITRFDLDTALSSSKKMISKDILSHELSELLIENLKLVHSMNGFRLISNEPESISQQDAINISYQIKDEYDNIIKVNASYFIFDDKLYVINYIAPNQYYYSKDLEKYNSIKKSIKLDS